MAVESMLQNGTEQKDKALPGVTLEELTILRKVFANFPAIRDVVLFGSRIKGTHKENSDLDILFSVVGKSRSQINDMKFWIQELLSREIAYPMHVKEKSEITNPILLQTIMSEGVRL